VPGIVSRTTALLAQASLVDDDDLKLWVPIGATAAGISVQGCVSLQPAATKRVQFIAIGIQPLLNEHGSNVFYDDLNRMFENSSFGIIEEATIRKDEQSFESQKFTGKELKPKKGIDRWPMFFLQIMVDAEASLVGVDEFLDERRQNVAVIADLIQVMAYEFLKKHHFRPKPTAAIERLKRPKRNSPGLPPQPPAGLSTAPRDGQVDRRAERFAPSHKPRKQIAPRSKHHTDKTRLSSPFISWSKTKPHTEVESSSKTSVSPATGQETLRTAPRPENPLFDKSGGLVRKPFDDDDVDDSTTGRGHSPCRSRQVEQGVDTVGSARDTVVWVDPTTKIKSLIDPRTGFAVKPRVTTSPTVKPQLASNERSADISRLRRWKPVAIERQETIIQPTGPRIPQVFQSFNSFCCSHGSGNFETPDLGGLTAAENPNGNVLATLEGRISKTLLQLAEVVAQVDHKFILTKVGADIQTASAGGALESDSLLILIDQHAADERCKVEDLLKVYFISGPETGGRRVAQTQCLDKPLRFDLSKQEGDLLTRFKKHFAHWGIAYEILHEQSPRVTVEAQSLPPSIAERCRLEPRILIDLLRKEAWKLHETGSSGMKKPAHTSRDDDWVTRFHDCPDGIMELINSRACRSKCFGLKHTDSAN
jgi:DNA mismatch repair protein MLH3